MLSVCRINDEGRNYGQEQTTNNKRERDLKSLYKQRTLDKECATM